MKTTILFFSIPTLIYFALYNFIEDDKDLLLISLLITTVIYWASNLIPDYYTSLIFIFVSLSFSLTPKELIFSGFSSPAFWLVFSGMLIANAINKVKLSEQMISFFSKIKNPSYFNLLIIISIFSLSFAFIMPSGVGRVVLLIPISIIVAKNFGFEKKDKGYTGIILCFILCTTIPGFSILPANAPNMIMIGLISEIYNINLLYSHYLFSNFLMLGILKNIFIVLLLYYFFKDTTKIKDNSKEKNIEKTKEQKIVITTLIIMIGFWLTDFIHGINPSIIAMIGILFLSFPKIGIINTKDINTLNFSSLIFLAGVISFGSVTANSDFIKESLTLILNNFNIFETRFLNFFVITSFMSFSGLFLTQATIPAIYTPIATELSILSGFNINEIFMMQVTAFSTVFLPYQMAPLIIGVKLAELKQRDMIKIILSLAIITIFIILPLQYLWINLLE